ncbi:MAG: hypothetical protein V3U84_07030 [Thiotrichaceae bacterium]
MDKDKVIEGLVEYAYKRGMLEQLKESCEQRLRANDLKQPDPRRIVESLTTNNSNGRDSP